MHRSEDNDGYILIQARSEDGVSQLAELITRTPGVVKVERVHGPYDVIAVTRGTNGGARVPSPVHAISRLDGVLRAIPLAIASSVGASETAAGEAA